MNASIFETVLVSRAPSSSLKVDASHAFCFDAVGASLPEPFSRRTRSGASFTVRTAASLEEPSSAGSVTSEMTAPLNERRCLTLPDESIDATSGRLVWTFPDGKYSPVVADAARLYLIGNARLYGLDERRQVTPRKLSAVTALGVLRRAGFKHVRVIGTRPLALRLGKGHKRSRRNVCHIALFGAEVNVRRGAAVLRKVCR